MSEDLDPVELLVEQVQAGIDPEENFRKLFERFRQPIFSYFRRKGFSDEESLDLTQDSFLQVARSLDTFRGNSRFPVWLFGVVSNVYRTQIRRRHAERREGVEVSMDEAPGLDRTASATIRPGEGSALDLAIARERRTSVRAALEDLPPQMRRCCVLRYERGLKYQEIATLMGISIETVKAHLHQGRKRLAERLEDGGLS
jgi:RNA polymerase sigma-70 factor (ECF subfamily)